MNMISTALADGLRPDPELTISQWAEEYRILPEGSAEPGPWNRNRAPYLNEIMDCLSHSHPASEVVSMLASQMGKNELLNNWLLASIDKSPAPMMMVLPTLGDAEIYSKTRIAKSLKAQPEIEKKIGAAKSRDSNNSLLLKQFPGGFLTLAGSNSASSLASKPIKLLAMDEIDRYPPDCEGEGNPIDLAEIRISNYSFSKIYKSSTPVQEGKSNIEEAYGKTDRRRYHVPCPECENLQVLKWPNLKYEISDQFKTLKKNSIYYLCEHCGHHILEHEKTWMLEQGIWIAQNPEVTDKVGFWLNALYAPIGWTSWQKLAEEWIDAQNTKDQRKLKKFLNTRLAETWRQPGEKIDHSDLYNRREKYKLIPAEVAVLTAGFDTQDNRIEVSVYGWGRNEECWGILHEVIPGDTSINPDLKDGNNVWTKASRFLDKKFETELGAEMPIYKSCIDTQGHQTKNAAEFLKLLKNRHFKIHGISGAPNAKNLISEPSKENKYKIELFSVGVDIAKEVLAGRLKSQPDGSIHIHYNESFGEMFFRQLTSEKKVIKYTANGEKFSWEKPHHARNEAWDCLVYAYAAKQILNPNIEAFLQWHKQLANPSAPGQKNGSNSGRKIRSKGIK